ncbi:MAG: hypothetical protein Q8N37_00650 [bacterium]|nr:hypothetical protein [bacterium]
MKWFEKLFGKKAEESEEEKESGVIEIKTIGEWEKQKVSQNLETVEVGDSTIKVKELYELKPRVFSVFRAIKMHEYIGDILAPAYVGFLLQSQPYRS